MSYTSFILLFIFTVLILILFRKLHFFGLFDGDPFGMEIMSTLVNGSITLRHEKLAIPIEHRHRVHWIGIRTSDYRYIGFVTTY